MFYITKKLMRSSKIRVSKTVKKSIKKKNYLPKLIELLLLISIMVRRDTEDVDDLREVVKVNDEGGAVSGGGEGADEHERPVEVVGASEEPGERHRGRRRLDLLGLVDLVLLLELLRRRVRALVEVRRRRLGRLGHLGHGR